MGKREFYAWVEQLHDEHVKRQQGEDTWDASENDPAWQKMRDKREKARGR